MFWFQVRALDSYFRGTVWHSFARPASPGPVTAIYVGAGSTAERSVCPQDISWRWPTLKSSYVWNVHSECVCAHVCMQGECKPSHAASSHNRCGIHSCFHPLEWSGGCQFQHLSTLRQHHYFYLTIELFFLSHLGNATVCCRRYVNLPLVHCPGCHNKSVWESSYPLRHLGT